MQSQSACKVLLRSVLPCSEHFRQRHETRSQQWLSVLDDTIEKILYSSLSRYKSAAYNAKICTSTACSLLLKEKRRTHILHRISPSRFYARNKTPALQSNKRLVRIQISVGYLPAPVNPPLGPPTADAAIGPDPPCPRPPLIPGMLKSGFPASKTSCCLLSADADATDPGGGLQFGLTGRSEIDVKWLASLARSEPWPSKLPPEACWGSTEMSPSELLASLAPAPV